MKEGMKILESDDLDKFNLDDGLYGQFFLINTSLNNVEPEPWRINPRNFEKIVRSFEGRPFLIPPKLEDGSWYPDHFVAASIKDTLNNQISWAAGEIVKTFINYETGNANAIVKFFDEYKDQIMRGDLPNEVSPMLAVLDAESKQNIMDGFGVHLQAVPDGGYEPKFTRVKSFCSGMANECTEKLRVVAANKGLRELSKTKHALNTNIYPTESITMSDEILTKLDKVLQLVQANQLQTGMQVKVASEDTTKQLDTVKADYEKLQKDFDTQKSEYLKREQELTKREEAITLAERKSLAKDIVESKIKLHKLPLDKKDSEIDRLVNLKKGDNFVDLELVRDELTEAVKGIVSASKRHSIPEMGSPSTDFDAFSTSEAIGV